MSCEGGLTSEGEGEWSFGAFTYTQGIVNEGQRLSGGVTEESPFERRRSTVVVCYSL